MGRIAQLVSLHMAWSSTSIEIIAYKKDPVLFPQLELSMTPRNWQMLSTTVLDEEIESLYQLYLPPLQDLSLVLVGTHSTGGYCRDNDGSFIRRRSSFFFFMTGAKSKGEEKTSCPMGRKNHHRVSQSVSRLLTISNCGTAGAVKLELAGSRGFQFRPFARRAFL